MMRRILVSAAVLVGLTLAAGCSASSAGHTSFTIGKNLLRKDTNMRIFLDKQQASQSTLKKGVMGHAAFKVKEPVGTSPIFRYEVVDPKKFGFIKSTGMQVHPKFEADYSDIPEFVVTPVANDKCMKENIDYDLGSLGPDFMILDRHDNKVDKVEFKPGVEYLLVFTVQADQSESIQIFFKTK